MTSPDTRTPTAAEPAPSTGRPAPASRFPSRFRLNGAGRLLSNRTAALGLGILSIFFLIAVFGPWIAPGDPLEFADLPHQPPSMGHPLGTTGQGQDVFRQVIQGTRRSLGVGVAVGIAATLVGTLIGIGAGYLGGRIDDLLSMLMNIFLLLPGLPLLVALAAFLPPGELTIIFALTFTGWAWPARVMRAQTLSIREKDFVSVAVVSGESPLRIMLWEILPNMASMVAGTLVGSTIYGISAQAGLEFLGLGNISAVSWGTILYWAGNNAGLLTGAWWTFIPAGMCIALVAFALAMINYAMDEVTNPRLRTEKETVNALRKHARRTKAGRSNG